jgi:hypothetical protein
LKIDGGPKYGKFKALPLSFGLIDLGSPIAVLGYPLFNDTDPPTLSFNGSSGFLVGEFVSINTYADRFALENYRVSSSSGGYKSRPPQ